MKPSSPSSCNIVQETLSPSSNGTTAAGCISKILRRILCFSSLSYSCPFDHHTKEEQRESSAIGGAVPGIVARLMGLSSLPRIEPIEGSPTISSCPDSFKKSRSPQVVMRRKIRVPAYQELEDDKFFILSFERRGDRHGSHVERWRLSKNSDRTEQSKCKKKSMRRTRENLQGKNKENRGLLMVSKGTLDRDYEVDQNPSNVLLDSCRKPEKRRKKKGNGDRFAAFNVEREGDSENSSPNSVLEFVEFPTDQESSCTGLPTASSFSFFLVPFCVIYQLIKSWACLKSA